MVLGRNGVGKTTLLKSLMGVVPVKAGSMRDAGRRRHHQGPQATNACKRGIGYVPQGREIFGPPDGGREPAHGPGHEERRHGDPGRAVRAVPHPPSSSCTAAGGDLSGGQQQQLAIARALAAGPKLLMLDEPTEGIQPSIIKDIGRVIRMLADRKTMAIVLVEQYYDFAAELADQYLVMERGEVIATRPRRRHGNRWRAGEDVDLNQAAIIHRVKPARPPLVQSGKPGTGGRSGLHRVA